MSTTTEPTTKEQAVEALSEIGRRVARAKKVYPTPDEIQSAIDAGVTHGVTPSEMVDRTGLSRNAVWKYRNRES